MDLQFSCQPEGLIFNNADIHNLYLWPNFPAALKTYKIVYFITLMGFHSKHLVIEFIQPLVVEHKFRYFSRGNKIFPLKREVVINSL